MRIVLQDRNATERLAAALAARAHPGDCLALSGSLGAGKSTLARAFLRALSGDPALDVPSPSFALVQPYDTPRGTVFHFDLWRLNGPESLHELGWDEAAEGIMLVEWPERAGDLLPPGALRLTLSPGEAEDERIAELSGWDAMRLENL